MFILSLSDLLSKIGFSTMKFVNNFGIWYP